MYDSHETDIHQQRLLVWTEFTVSLPVCLEYLSFLKVKLYPNLNFIWNLWQIFFQKCPAFSSVNLPINSDLATKCRYPSSMTQQPSCFTLGVMCSECKDLTQMIFGMLVKKFRFVTSHQSIFLYIFALFSTQHVENCKKLFSFCYLSIKGRFVECTDNSCQESTDFPTLAHEIWAPPVLPRTSCLLLLTS